MIQKVRLASKIQKDSILDGEGIRAVIWMQGCMHNCKGCHNPDTHSLTGGTEVLLKDLFKEIDKLDKQDGITLSGGDPLFQIPQALEIAKYAKSKNLNIWLYTGFTFEELLEAIPKNHLILELLENTDILVDGRFIEDKKSLNLKFRGSKNQRIINVKRSLKEKRVVEVKKYKKEKSGYTDYDKNIMFGEGIYI